MKENIEEIKKKALPILRKHGVSKAGVFGSYARGEQKEKSDIDILIKITEKASLTDIIKLQLALQKCFRRKEIGRASCRERV